MVADAEKEPQEMGWVIMETLEDIKIYIADMEKYCKVIDSDATIPSKIAFNAIMRDVAKRIAEKCDKLEKELDKNADTDR